MSGFLALLHHKRLPRRRLQRVYGRKFCKDKGKNTFVGKLLQRVGHFNASLSFLNANARSILFKNLIEDCHFLPPAPQFS